MAAMVWLSFAIVNAGEDFLFYGMTALLFFVSGLLIKRAYIFFGILVLAFVFVFLVKDVMPGIFSDGTGSILDFFINSNK